MDGPGADRASAAREVDPLAPYPYATTGFCLLAAGRAAESLQYLAQALAFDAENALALWTNGAAPVALERAEQGVALLERANTPTHRGGHIHATLGWALAAAGRLDDARSVLDFLRARPAPAAPVIAEGWLRIRHNGQFDVDRPRTGVSLGIVDGDLNLQVAVVRPAEPLCDFRGIGQGTACRIQPLIVT